MYQPAHFREDRIEVQHDLIRRHPLGLLVTAGPGGLTANQIPFLIYSEEGELGTLRAHLARGNPQWRELSQVEDCLAVFQGPQIYITPSWYATKRQTGKVVPTWNYVTVHAWGRPRVVEDTAWLRRQLDDLTASAGTAPRPALGGERRARAIHRIPDEGHHRRRDPGRAHRGQVEGQPEPARGRSCRRRVRSGR
jgi:transcriptional regulator